MWWLMMRMMIWDQEGFPFSAMSPNGPDWIGESKSASKIIDDSPELVVSWLSISIISMLTIYIIKGITLQHTLYSLLSLPPLQSYNMPPAQTNDSERPREPIVSPYMPKYPDPNSNISNFKIIESTLRGKQQHHFYKSHVLITFYRGRTICQCFL